MRSFPLIVFMLTCSGAAVASEGVLQINQACAAVGCFEGDGPGFPVTITHSGSYRLTGNLDLGDSASPATATAIDISDEGHLTLDLNGFTIQGGITCDGFPTVTSCSAAAASGYGVKSTPPGVTIRNGHVRGMSYGVACLNDCLIENIQAYGNAGTGVTTQNAASVIVHSAARRNGGNGFTVTGSIRDSAAEGNKDYGIFMQPTGLARGNVVRDNGGNGFRCYSCILHDNVSMYNTGYGVELAGRAAWGGNLVSDNDAGTVTGSGLALGTNRCDSSACP